MIGNYFKNKLPALYETVKRQKTYFLGALIFLSAVGVMLFATATAVKAEGETATLDCLSCHPKTLQFHDQLGSGNEACWTCHSSTNMFMLRLVNGTAIPLAESPQLCGQCHQVRYTAWNEGTHGIPGTVASGKCTDCHNPHAPQMNFVGITKPHPDPTPPPPAVPFDLVMIVAVSLGFLIILAFIVARQGQS
jgi:hypothetical protein